MKFSKRVFAINEPQTIGMAKLARKLKSEGLDIISLSLGEPDFDTPIAIKIAAIKAIQDGKTKYPPVAGIPELRQAICDKLLRENDLEYKPENTLVSAGAKHSIANVVLAMIDEGDEVIIPTPYWVSYSAIVDMVGGTSVFVDGSFENKYKITPAQLEAAITPKSKLMIFSSPCNPTGESYNQAELDALAEVLVKYPDILVMSDEIYEYINFGEKHVSIAHCPGMKDRTVVINGASKGFAMTGWRLGYMAGSAELVEKCELIQSQVTSGVNSITQYAMVEALNMNREVVVEMREAFRKRRDLLISEFHTIPDIKISTPDGAFYVFPDVSAYYGKSYEGQVIENSEQMAMLILEKGLVATVPGVAFGAPHCIRISYAADITLLKEAMNRIKTVFSKFN